MDRVLDDAALELGALGGGVAIRLEGEERPEDFPQQADGEGSGTDGRVADFHLVEERDDRLAMLRYERVLALMLRRILLVEEDFQLLVFSQVGLEVVKQTLAALEGDDGLGRVEGPLSLLSSSRFSKMWLSISGSMPIS